MKLKPPKTKAGCCLWLVCESCLWSIVGTIGYFIVIAVLQRPFAWSAFLCALLLCALPGFYHGILWLYRNTNLHQKSSTEK